MNHEKIFSRPDGSRVKIVVSVYTDIVSGVKWNYFVLICEPRKRTWRSVTDSDSYEYRALSMEDRRKKNESDYLKVATSDEILAAKTELWEKLKPAL